MHTNNPDQAQSQDMNITENKTTQKIDEKLRNVKSFAYQLQDIDLKAIEKTNFDLIIIDYSRDGTDENRFTKEEIDSLKSSFKIALSYLSIGEAENYRWYWNNAWDKNNDGIPDSGAPSWLGPENPEWPGNYKVKYWDPEWKQIIFKYLDKIIEANFDGVYLDIIDAYEYWGPGGESGLNRKTAEQEMIDFVKSIANYTRVTKGKKDFLIFPQNGEKLGTHIDYVNTVNGIGKEDLFYLDNTPQPESYVNESISYLNMFKDNGKLVLIIDYPTDPFLINEFYKKAREKGYIPYFSSTQIKNPVK
ncbi:MJ1477/TM1410 family putative glycoside hydrolase [Caldanaerobacter sp.]|uniref:MJ1477/TM1410 family putative glycoside hydrolase n=1 Tax=Caldanaerobacter sp. TaxID=2930036 RepID=UPI003C789D74